MLVTPHGFHKSKFSQSRVNPRTTFLCSPLSPQCLLSARLPFISFSLITAMLGSAWLQWRLKTLLKALSLVSMLHVSCALVETTAVRKRQA